jgi:hypothetical protein
MKTSGGRTRLRLAQAGGLVTLAMVFWAGTPVSGQGTPSRDNDTRNWQTASMDRFLDSHPEIAEQLHKDPSLIGNHEFVTHHPALQEYLQQNPGVREEFSENPNAFMRQEQRFEGRDEAGGNRVFGDRDTTRGELVNMDRFLDSHPEIAEQLRKDPSLMKNHEFVQKHPELQEFVQQHPQVSEEFSENPNAFMQAEQRFEQREQGGDNGRFGDRDTTRGELANMDRFLDSHPEIAEQVSKNPSLINDHKFVQKHPELQEYLQQHPGVREEFSENPNAFMQTEQRFEQREEAADNGRFGDRDTTRGELANMDRFLDRHPEIAEQVSKNPSLVKNREFVEKHPELHEYLQQHPGVSEEVNENPNALMRREERFDRHEEAWRGGDRDMNQGDMTSFGRFLGGHSSLAQQLSKDPSLINNKEWLESHPEVRDYLTSHPGAKQKLAQNPKVFMNSVPPAGNATTASKPLPPKPKQ